MIAIAALLQRGVGAALLAGLICVAAQAQDIFEIQVYEYPTVEKGRWNLETHLNYIARGTKTFEGRVAPPDRVFHMSYELTRGIAQNFELAGYLLTAARRWG